MLWQEKIWTQLDVLPHTTSSSCSALTSVLLSLPGQHLCVLSDPVQGKGECCHSHQVVHQFGLAREERILTKVERQAGKQERLPLEKHGLQLLHLHHCLLQEFQGRPVLKRQQLLLLDLAGYSLEE